MTNEVWKPIPNYEGLYEVSNTGKIKSCERISIHSKSGFIKIKSRLLKPQDDGNSYLNVRLYKNGQYKKFKVHRLVMFGFYGYSNLTVDHIDGNTQNNDISNLRYCSQRENNVYARLKIKSSSTYPGVSYCRFTNKWKSAIGINGKTKTIGRFDSEIEAANAYQLQLNLLK